MYKAFLSNYVAPPGPRRLSFGIFQLGFFVCSFFFVLTTFLAQRRTKISFDLGGGVKLPMNQLKRERERERESDGEGHRGKKRRPPALLLHQTANTKSAYEFKLSTFFRPGGGGGIQRAV